MTFSIDTHWVWDFWLADDGETFHMFYLHAPKSLGDERLRHRNARIGHAVSTDLSSWVDRGLVIDAGAPGDFDETATWTGSVVRAPDGTWLMFYTGARFLSEQSTANVESVGVATSTDLHEWTKLPGPIVSADPRWYETIDDASWPEEAWRDPWVYADPDGMGWHMLITARANSGPDDDRGVIAHARSADLQTWQVQPPLSAAGAGFKHLEVPQVTMMGEKGLLLFSCDGPALAGSRAGTVGGIWGLATASTTGPFAVESATLLAPETLYSGRIIRDRSGQWVMLGFLNSTADGGFIGELSDPIAIRWSAGATTAELDVVA